MGAFTHVQLIRAMFCASISLSIINVVSGLALVVVIITARHLSAKPSGDLGEEKIY